MSPQQIGHLMSDTEHSLQVARCPHGMKTVSISLSIHILHSFSLWSFCSFSSGSSSGRKELQTHRFINTLLIRSCCDSGTTFLVGSPCGEPLKQSSTRAQEPGPAWLSLFRITVFLCWILEPQKMNYCLCVRTISRCRKSILIRTLKTSRDIYDQDINAAPRYGE